MTCSSPGVTDLHPRHSGGSRQKWMRDRLGNASTGPRRPSGPDVVTPQPDRRVYRVADFEDRQVAGEDLVHRPWSVFREWKEAPGDDWELLRARRRAGQ